jgi:gliding motility-associated-like protein
LFVGGIAPLTVSAQWVYLLGHKSTSNYLQRINIATLEVVDVVRITGPELTDIAFHPDGTLYCVEFSKFSILDTITGFRTLVKDFVGFDAVGLAVDYNGIFYLSGTYTATLELAIIKYNKETDEILKISSFLPYNFTHIDDLDFYIGGLYAVGLLPSNYAERQVLFKVDTASLVNHDTIVTYEFGQCASLSSINDTCASLNLVGISSGKLQFFYPDLDSVNSINVTSPLNFRAGGSASRKGWMGSLPPLLIKDISIIHSPCEPNQLAEIIVENNPDRQLSTFFSLDGIAYQDSNHFTNILPGLYKVHLKDAWGCEVVSDTFEIKVNGDFSYNFETSPTFCGLNNGTLSVTSLNPTDNLIFSIDKTNFYSDTLFEFLDSGEVTLFILNNEGCLDSSIINIGLIEPPILSLSSIPETCSQANGEISAEVNLGISPFEFSLDGMPLQDNGIFLNLVAGLHEVEVIDNLGCSAKDTITIEFIEGPKIDSIVNTDPSCGKSDGVIQVYASSDFSTVLYLLNSGTPNSSNIFTSLSAGSYDVTVIDTFGCNITSEITLTQNTPVSIVNIASLPAHCNTNTGSLNIEVSSSEVLQYNINGGLPQTSSTFNNLYPGSYLISITNEDGCTDTMSAVIENEPGIIIDSISITHASCELNNGSIQIHTNGTDPKYSINNGIPQSNSIFLNLSEGNYSINVIDVNGCIDTSFVTIWQFGGPSIMSIESSPEHCNLSDGGLVISHYSTGTLPLLFKLNNGLFQSDSTFVGLESGEYLIEITDSNGCVDTDTAEVELLDAPFIKTVDVVPELCDESNAELMVTADSPFPLLFTLGNATNTAGHFFDLSSGDYSITVEDPYGCKDTKEIIIGDINNLTIPEIIIQSTGCDKKTGSIKVLGDENLTLYIEELPNQSWNSIINDLPNGVYNLRLVNNDGCFLDTLINVPEECELYIPNTFSPNGDNVNDEFGTSNLSSVTTWEFSIFDRSGNLLYYNTDPSTGWDGTYKGKIAQTGVYTWTLVYRLANGEIDIYRFGDVTLIR